MDGFDEDAAAVYDENPYSLSDDKSDRVKGRLGYDFNKLKKSRPEGRQVQWFMMRDLDLREPSIACGRKVGTPFPIVGVATQHAVFTAEAVGAHERG